MAYGRHIEHRFFGHNSAADCPILVKFCVRKQFSKNFDNGTDYTCVPQNVFLVFITQFGFGERLFLYIVSDTLVIDIYISFITSGFITLLSFPSSDCYTRALGRYKTFQCAHGQ